MAWVFLVVVLALGAGLLIINFGYTKSIVVLLGVLLIGLILLIWYGQFYEDSRSSLIPVDQVKIDNFSVKAAYGDSYDMFARLYNESKQYSLSGVDLELSAQDCVSGGGAAEGCVIVGQQQKEIRVDVPAGQARDVTQKFIFPPMRPQGVLKWEYTILGTRAQR